MVEKKKKEGMILGEEGEEDIHQFVTYMERYQFKGLGSILI